MFYGNCDKYLAFPHIEYSESHDGYCSDPGEIVKTKKNHWFKIPLTNFSRKFRDEHFNKYNDDLAFRDEDYESHNKFWLDLRETVEKDQDNYSANLVDALRSYVSSNGSLKRVDGYGCHGSGYCGCNPGYDEIGEPKIITKKPEVREYDVWD
jgi:hypothetical protein